MPVDPDPRAHVASSEDFYALLSLSPDTFTPEIFARQRRKTALQLHPDKTIRPGASEADKDRARERWDLFEVAVKLLENDALRTQYNNTRAAREQKRARDAAQGAKRREMLSRLERAEAAAAGGPLGRKPPENEQERETRRLAAEGARMREDFARRRRAEAEAEAEAQRADEADAMEVDDAGRERDRDRDGKRSSQSSSSEARTVKVRYPVSFEQQVNASLLESLFGTFGAIDAVAMGSVKKERLRPSDARRTPVVRAFVQFRDRRAARDAVDTWPTMRKRVAEEWQRELDVGWMVKESSSGGSRSAGADGDRVGGRESGREGHEAAVRTTEADHQSLHSYQQAVFAKMRSAAGRDPAEPPARRPEWSGPVPSFKSFRPSGAAEVRRDEEGRKDVRRTEDRDGSYRDRVFGRMREETRRRDGNAGGE